ncbi:HPr-rel-A system PqqD family peptide chaperone [Rhodoferax ferrireducens]|uniref:HPr-rel-A system PqqD family peptide chaperone n=1 Tax=Rhodoferax ferrireducens TaxID=192843 RepID=UPI00298E236A|nr:HPr-rel-A system PqqD family peptide chaperone [Rhodoferax ferrireducens]WPC67678.1 HPr-rel-A system PqqD family peptide chaperone [Rhodoferax ferrireducens]
MAHPFIERTVLALWSTVSPARLSFASWDDDDLAVVYDKVTGDTHLIESSAIEILRVIEKYPASAEAIAQELAELFSADDQDKLPQFISASLLQLRDLGLVTDTPV